MTVAYLAIGDEILRGETREGNGHTLAGHLTRRGLQIERFEVVADERTAIVERVRALATQSRLIVISGGLGPTDDDGTRTALADAAGVPLALDPDLEAALERRYANRGRRFMSANRRQAHIPTGARALANPDGTAPGFAVTVGEATAACFPGVPREFDAMVDHHLDELLAGVGVQATLRAEHTLRVFGITESDLQTRLSGLPGYDQVSVRSLPRFPEIRLAISPQHDGGDVASFVAAVRRNLQWRVFSEHPTETHAEAVVRDLQAGDMTVAVAESCTGGLIGHLLTEVPGVSATLVADLVCYANSAKRALLGVPAATLQAHGAVSEPTARAMAEGARAAADSYWGLATTGIAGPTGGSEDRPVGTVYVAVAGPHGTGCWRYGFGPIGRSRFKRLVAFTALARLRSEARAETSATN